MGPNFPWTFGPTGYVGRVGEHWKDSQVLFHVLLVFLSAKAHF